MGELSYQCFGQEARPWELVRQIAGCLPSGFLCVPSHGDCPVGNP
ncbi:hypothetical protein SAMN02787118_105173 [Streptomyces mirabilis]|jgi:hypothetical protein|uniref:Uncharacterized protein n=1 Tax=Streptomyces mirabilis TaxID=68239 RepID=A0A1I2HHZ4_9ACTN|nr:hypothetical protein SAMN02787118_105173 [Streptomyces mirabilis]